MTTTRHNDVIDVRQIRSKLGMNQREFWGKLGVTQSGGSRFECGRKMPKPVQQMLHLVYVEKIDIDKIKRVDYEVIEFLRAHEGKLFRELKKLARAARHG